MGQAPSWIALDAGYFSGQGLDAALTYIEGGAKTTAAMIGGSVDTAEMTGEPAIVAQSKGADLVIVGSLNNYFHLQLVADPSIKRIADLKGKTVALNAGGSSDDFLLTKILKANGLSRQDVSTASLGGADQAKIAALQTHKVDATLVGLDNVPEAIKGGAVLLVDTVTAKVPYPQNTLVTTRAYLKAHRPEVLGFLKAEAQAVHRFKTDKSYALQVSGKYLKAADPSSLEQAYSGFSQLLPDSLRPSAEAVSAILQQDNITDHSPEDFMDLSLVDELASSGFLKSL